MAQDLKSSIWRCGAEELLSFECPVHWSDLNETDDPRIRQCGKCNELVHLCSSPEDFLAQAKAKACVAIPVNWDVPDTAKTINLMLGRPAPWNFELDEAAAKFWIELEHIGNDLGAQFAKELDRNRRRRAEIAFNLRESNEIRGASEVSKIAAWSDWALFPDPRQGHYLNAPFGPGVYELRRSDTKEKELILCGEGRNCAYRMASLLPQPFGMGKRNNTEKRDYVLEHLGFIEYRTLPCETKSEAKTIEAQLLRDPDRRYHFPS